MILETTQHDLFPLEEVAIYLRKKFSGTKSPGTLGSKPAALIDIDSTVMDTGPRNMAIIQEAAREAFPELRSEVEGLRVEDLGWNLTVGLARKLAMGPERTEELRIFWEERFFSNFWLLHDTPYPGVQEVLAALQEMGLRLLYLTGRDRPRMAEGTIETFLNHRIPFNSPKDFMFKPDPREDDLLFKKRSLEEAQKRGEIVLVLENEPANANRMRRAYPDALVFCINTITTENPEPLDEGIMVFHRYR